MSSLKDRIRLFENGGQETLEKNDDNAKSRSNQSASTSPRTTTTPITRARL